MQKLVTSPTAHFIEKTLIDPGNPILIDVIGIGGTGSYVLSFLASVHSVLIRTGHPGLLIRAYDEDVIADHNCGRQQFFASEIGYPKAAASIHRINRAHGTDWRAVLFPFCLKYKEEIEEQQSPQIVISCVDTVKSRFEIEEILVAIASEQSNEYVRDQLHYWMDFGNSRYIGQAQLGTLRPIKQPQSEEYTAVHTLPLFTGEYRSKLLGVNDNDEPSCSLEQSLERQDLFINPTLAIHGTRLLYRLLTQKRIDYRGIFVNIDDLKVVPMTIAAPVAKPSEQEILYELKSAI